MQHNVHYNIQNHKNNNNNNNNNKTPPHYKYQRYRNKNNITLITGIKVNNSRFSIYLAAQSLLALICACPSCSLSEASNNPGLFFILSKLLIYSDICRKLEFVH